MHKLVLPFALFAFLLSACCKDDNLLVEILLPHSPGGITNCDSSKATAYAGKFSVPAYLRDVALSEGSKVLLASQDGLYWMDITTGKMLHQIESPVAGKAFSNTDALYRNGDLAAAASATGLAVFNVKTGELMWERALGECDIDKGVYGVGDQYFVTRHVPDAEGIVADAVFVGNLREPNRLDLLFTPAYSHAHHSWAGYGRITSLTPFMGADGHTYVLSAYFETQASSNALRAFMALFDVTTKSWVYERQELTTASLIIIYNSVQQITVRGTTAYLSWMGKILVWNISSGTVLETISMTPANSMQDGFYGDLLVSEQYILVKDNNAALQVLDNATHQPLYSIRPLSGTLRAAFDLDRLFVTNWDRIDVYEISTGKKLETILPACDQFSDGIVVWKDVYGTTHVAVGNGSAIKHYVLQN